MELSRLASDNEPTNPKLWEKCKDVAKSRYTKWPSAYAVGHALKLYKDEGGGWRAKKSAREVTKIDPEWVKGLRAWVKKTFAPKAQYASLEDLIAHFKTLLDKDIHLLWEYLFFTKGLLPSRYYNSRSVPERLRVKIRDELKVAEELIEEDFWKFRHTMKAMTPGTDAYKRDQMRDQNSVLAFYQRINPDDPFAAALRGYEETARETLAKVVDILSGKLLRAITAFLGKYADDETYRQHEILLEYDIGRVKLVYDGEPERHLIDRPDPADPRGLSDYIPYFKKAKALLDQKGFGDLWYGPIFVGCPKCGGENPYGKHLGVGAHYVIGPDHLVVFLEPKPSIVEILIHELGHRYYFKFMDRDDRLRFDSYFKEVAAVSEYGGTDTEEDFAETFTHFVLGRDMTRDQIERFKAFLAKKDRGRFAAEREFKMPRKFDRAHCESKTCDEMGFTEKASCRPYKNCYKGASAARVASRYLAAKGKAKKDVGHGGLDEWFSGHDKGPGEAQWGDWVAISPVKRTITREDGTKKTYKPGDIIGPCGSLTDDPDWKDLTRGGKTPFKCMARPKAHDMPKAERAEKAREKMKVQEKAPKGKKPVFTPTFKDDEE